MCPINYVLSLLKKRNYFENFFMYMGILTTNETYTFSKAGLETEWQQWGRAWDMRQRIWTYVWILHLLAI